jgi:hypothetical protein
LARVSERKKLGRQLIPLMPQGHPFAKKFDAAIKVSLLVMKYDPGTVIDSFAWGFKFCLEKCGLKRNIPNDKALKYLNEYFFGNESLLKTWREEVGSPPSDRN